MVRWRIAIREARGVIHIGRSMGTPRQRVLTSDVQGVSLVVIQQRKSVAERKIGEPSVDIPEAQGQLVGVGQVDLGAIMNAWRTQGEFPPIDARTLDGDGEKDVGIIEVVVVEEIVGASQKIVGVECPSSDRNRHSKLMFFIALPVQGGKAQVLTGGKLDQRTGDGVQRRRLV